jgi:hypothetical protein
MWIIGLSLSMDVLIIGMMSLKNSFVYMQFHPLAYIVKLKIESKQFIISRHWIEILTQIHSVHGRPHCKSFKYSAEQPPR